MKKILVFSVVGMLLGTSLWAKSIDQTEYKKGQDLYSDKCHICHGKRGEGNGPGAVAFLMAAVQIMTGSAGMLQTITPSISWPG